MSLKMCFPLIGLSMSWHGLQILILAMVLDVHLIGIKHMVQIKCDI